MSKTNPNQPPVNMDVAETTAYTHILADGTQIDWRDSSPDLAEAMAATLGAERGSPVTMSTKRTVFKGPKGTQASAGFAAQYNQAITKSPLLGGMEAVRMATTETDEAGTDVPTISLFITCARDSGIAQPELDAASLLLDARMQRALSPQQ